MTRAKHFCMLAALLPLAALAAPANAPLPAYQPHPAAPAPDAAYRLADGSIRIVGTEYVQGIAEALDALFVQSHPGLRFTLQLRGTGTAVPALTHGVTLFAPMGREANALELVPYKKIVGRPPLELRVAHTSNTSPTLPTSLALYVNRANPIDKLSLHQVAQIFSSGQPGGDLTRWSQLGLGGNWAGRAIHPYGTGETGGFGSHMQRHQLQGMPFSPAYEAAANTKAILERVGGDAAGIGFAAIGSADPRLKVVAVDAIGGGPASSGSAADVMAGRYAFGRYLYFTLRRGPGNALDPLAREYLRMVLSREGQAIISAGADGFLPLNARELAEELAKLDEPTHPTAIATP
jgi:phosphate transport system substrate-binding protein